MSSTYEVPSVSRAMKILELLAHSQRGLALSDISRRLEIPKSSAHVLIKTLEDLGYLRISKMNGRYSFGLKLVSLSNMALENLDLREQARPFLQQLMLRTGLTVHLAILEGTEAVIVEKVEPPGILRLATWVGRRLDANSSGVGKALLAFTVDEKHHKRFVSQPMARHNKNTISSPQRLARELQKVRRQGYAFEDEEGEIGFRCIGVPLYDSASRVIAAISIAGSTSQISNDKLPSLISAVKRTALLISEHLGCDSDTESVDERNRVLNEPAQLTQTGRSPGSIQHCD